MKKKRKKNPLDINLFDLHEEARKQPGRYKEAADEYANAVKRKDTAESNVELVEAQQFLKVKKFPEKFGLENPSVDLIKAAVKASSKYQTAVAEFNEAKYQAQVFKGLVDAYAQRKSMIETDTDLWFGSYFSAPKASTGERKRGRRRRE